MMFRTVLLLLTAAVLLASCNTQPSDKPNATGRTSEILVVCEKNYWDGPAGEAIRQALTRRIDGLPADEPEFTLINIPGKSFANILETHRNVLIVKLNQGIGKARTETSVNVWAHPQRVVTVFAGSDTAFVRVFNQHANSIRELYQLNERSRYQAQYTLVQDLPVQKMLADSFGISMIIPQEYYKARKASNFVWLRSETTTTGMGLFIYTFPYKSSAQLDTSAIMAMRDKYTKLYVPGSIDGSYMAVSRQPIRPVSKAIRFRGHYAVETRGLWHTVGDFMGGPFINYTIIDEKKNRLVVIDGYVYNPNKDKRNAVRQLEAIIWSTGFIKAAVSKP